MTCPSFTFDNPFEQENCTIRGPRIMLFLNQMKTALHQEKLHLTRNFFMSIFSSKINSYPIPTKCTLIIMEPPPWRQWRRWNRQNQPFFTFINLLDSLKTLSYENLLYIHKIYI